jgi:hypothetical protein
MRSATCAVDAQMAAPSAPYGVTTHTVPGRVANTIEDWLRSIAAKNRLESAAL